ncbi:MAG: hypothetical protein M3P85_09125 [Actinomycetota bacterium]|nr:hypothetical protein [Actinomycetota bacterium]
MAIGAAGLALPVAPAPAASGASFELVASKPQRVAPGDAAVYTIGITRSGGSADPVTLSVAGLPAGVTARFDPSPSTNMYSTLSLTTAATTPAGDYSLTVTGAGGSATRTATVGLTVLSPGQLGAEPKIRTVAGGFGEGPATQLAMGGFRLAIHDDRLYLSDGTRQAMWAVDLAGSDHTARVVAAPASFDHRAVPYPDSPNFMGPECPTGLPATSINPFQSGDGHTRQFGFDSAGSLYGIGCGIYKIDPSGMMTVIAFAGSSEQTGNPDPADDGEDIPALKTYEYGVDGVALDRRNHLYYLEAGGDQHCRIRRITPGADGVLNGSLDELVRTVAGGVTCGYAGDGRAARLATLNPEGGSLAFDPAGNLYFTEPLNHVVRKVAPGADGVIEGDDDEVITTFAGSAGAHPQFGCINGNYRGDGGPAADALLSCPSGIAWDRSGKNLLYIADQGNGRVRRVSVGRFCADPLCLVPGENRITTVAGTGRAGGEDEGDGGPATLAPLLEPSDVAVDGNDNLYIKAGKVRKVVPGADDVVGGDLDEVITTFVSPRTAGDLAQEGWVATKSQLGAGAAHFPESSSVLDNFPEGVAVAPRGEMYISDPGLCRVRKVDASGRITTVAGMVSLPPCASSGDGGPATKAGVFPVDVAVSTAGKLYISERCRVRKVEGGTITTVAGTGTCGFSGDGGPAREANIEARGIHLDAAGNLYLAGPDTCRVRKVDSSGTITTVAGTATCGGSGDGGRATSAQLKGPSEVVADASGNLYIADTGNCRVRKVDPSGTITTVVGNGTCGSLAFDYDGPATATALPPGGVFGVAADGAGNLYIAINVKFVTLVYRMDPRGNLSRVAGDNPNAFEGGAFFTGEGAPPKQTALREVRHLDVDDEGSVYIPGYGRVRKLNLPDFSLSASPSAQTVAGGKATSYTLTVAPTGGLTAPVTLGASGLPAGASASFGPNPTTGSSTMTLSTASSTPPGTYTVSITGTAGSLVRTATVTLTVTEAPSFSLSASPSSQSVVKGRSTSYAVTVSPTGGFSDPVTLSASGLPSGAAASFSPNPTTGSSTLTVSTKKTTKPGTYTLKITGTGGGLTRTVSVQLTVTRR